MKNCVAKGHLGLFFIVSVLSLQGCSSSQVKDAPAMKCKEEAEVRPFVLLVEDSTIDKTAASIVEAQFQNAEYKRIFCFDKVAYRDRRAIAVQAKSVAKQWANNPPDIIATSPEMSRYLAGKFKETAFLGFGWTHDKSLAFYWGIPGIGYMLGDEAGNIPLTPEDYQGDLFGEGPFGGLFEDGPPEGSPGSRTGIILPYSLYGN